jgi:ATP-dependent RNA helicase SUPV3L1/SUV3
VASTVEMADYHAPIDVAVIDEAQMIADADRGHNWTAAILGVPAREVHVCCAPHAERVVRQLVELCGDELEVRRHERLVPLRPDRGGFSLPAGVEPGDALVVFSRKAVHAVAAEVAAAGLRASVIYGALPHDVRHEEARRFDEGETDVVVATDAIGMGMNLPIRRIVFVEQQKYDGHDMRTLRPDEVQQIAGRAGRFGRYEEGLFTALERRRQIVRLYGADVPAIESIPVGVPEDIALVRDATLGESIRQWAALDQPEPFYRIDVQRDLRLIAEVEGMLAEDQRQDRDVKLKVLSLATMPFDEDDRTLHRTWRMMAEAELAGCMAMLPMPAEPGEDAPLATLEEEYRYCDLLYTYARTFGHEGWLAPLTDLRTRISHVIMTILAEA